MSEPRPRSRKRDFWQLDVPLVLSLILCTTLTIVMARRAAEGNWRSWIYLFEWPMIGAFCVWMWVRFKREPGGGFARQWRERVARYAQMDEAEDAGHGQGPDRVVVAPADPSRVDDPELAAWQEYRRRLQAEQDPTP